MGMRFEGEAVQREFAAAFGFDLADATPGQAMVLVKLVKHARLRCRSNAALYPYLGRVFPNLVFKDIEVQNPPGSKYPTRRSLRISQRAVRRPTIDVSKLDPAPVEDGGDDEE